MHITEFFLESYSFYSTCLSYAEKVVQRRSLYALAREAFLVQADSDWARMDYIWVRNDSVRNDCEYETTGYPFKESNIECCTQYAPPL